MINYVLGKNDQLYPGKKMINYVLEKRAAFYPGSIASDTCTSRK